MNKETICALATANGMGAIGVIRVSGDDSFLIVNKVFEGKTWKGNFPYRTLWLYKRCR